jgi:signal transduction histidine kinase
VFDRFYRAGDVRKLPGSGLGLAIVRQAAEACGGYAGAQNAPGGGALLRVSFGASFVYSGRGRKIRLVRIFNDPMDRRNFREYGESKPV